MIELNIINILHDPAVQWLIIVGAFGCLAILLAMPNKYKGGK